MLETIIGVIEAMCGQYYLLSSKFGHVYGGFLLNRNENTQCI